MVKRALARATSAAAVGVCPKCTSVIHLHLRKACGINTRHTFSLSMLAGLQSEIAKMTELKKITKKKVD